jgi:hypothetical protein
MFAPFGQIFEIEIVKALMQIPQIKGIKHSSEPRTEWQRLALRDEVRPEFKIYTATIWALIWRCMAVITYWAFHVCPEAFALRDKFWAEGGRSVLRAE